MKNSTKPTTQKVKLYYRNMGTNKFADLIVPTVEKAMLYYRSAKKNVRIRANDGHYSIKAVEWNKI